MARLGLAALTVLALAASTDAQAFGGAVVTDDAHTISSDAARVVYARTGQTSHVTVSPQVVGDATAFALVIPVPAVLTAADIVAGGDDTLAALGSLDAYSAPRLLGYSCEDLYPWLDPDYYYDYYDDYWYDWYDYYDGERRLFGNNWGRGGFDCTGQGCGAGRNPPPYRYYGDYDYGDYGQADTGGDTDGNGGGEVLGVAVSEQFTTGGYDVTVLTAEESAALSEWLVGQGLALGDEGTALAQGYIDQGWSFVVAKVTLETPPVGGAWLNPLRISYTTAAMTLPLRMGLSSGGDVMDLQLWVVNDYDDGRAGMANYRRVTVEEECMWDPALQADEFDAFYREWIADQLNEYSETDPSYAAWAYEFTWGRGACEPCPDGRPLGDSVLPQFGWDTDVSNAFVTRVKLRYTPDQLDQDPVLATNGTVNSSQLEFVAYEPSLESDFPVCGEGWIDNPSTCFDGTPRERTRQPRRRILTSAGSSMGLAGLALLGGLLFRRRR